MASLLRFSWHLIWGGKSTLSVKCLLFELELNTWSGNEPHPIWKEYLTLSQGGNAKISVYWYMWKIHIISTFFSESVLFYNGSPTFDSSWFLVVDYPAEQGKAFVIFWKDCLFDELQTRRSRNCRFLLFLHHNYQVPILNMVQIRTLVTRSKPYCFTPVFQRLIPVGFQLLITLLNRENQILLTCSGTLISPYNLHFKLKTNFSETLDIRFFNMCSVTRGVNCRHHRIYNITKTVHSEKFKMNRNGNSILSENICDLLLVWNVLSILLHYKCTLTKR